MERISVIVPVYKVEKYLDKCVESIVNQTYNNLEIILIDDGSPDNSPAICDAWAKKDGRIKVIHKDNGGVSRARNLGIDTATGEYLAFIDSDDQIHPEFFQLLYTAAKDLNADISACRLQFVEKYEDILFEDINGSEPKLYTPEEALKSFSEPTGFSAGPCNKLYHRSVLENERFVVDKRHEDEFFSYKVIANAKKLAFVDLGLYFYLQHDASFMHSISESHLDILEAYLEQIEFFKERFPQMYHKSKTGFCVGCVNYYIAVNDLPKEAAKRSKKRIRKYRRSIKITLHEFMSSNLKLKVYILLSKRLIGITSKVLSFTRRGRT